MVNKLDEYIIDYNFLSDFDIEHLRSKVIIPIKDEILYIIVAIHKEDENLGQISKIASKPIKTILSSKNTILQSLHLFEVKKELFTVSELCLKNENLSDSNIDRFLSLLIKTVLELKSSDIHIESCENTLIIRVRIDGILRHFITLEKEFISILSSFIKLKSNLDISLQRIPQDSRFSLFINENKYDFRVSTMPTIEGESIVLRILENSILNHDLAQLGFDTNIYSKIQENIHQANGLILITGPTGSGKTTTLYSIIKELNNTNKKIITIEDPVEYKIPKVQQISINNDIGLTFDKVLKNILRQDPDIILIGEIRDEESLKIAIQASLTGHLVFATLHTNSALNTINRIFDLNGEPFLLSSTLKSIISQRLVRKLCDKCKELDNSTKEYKAVGCESCNYDGFKGRVMLYEIINMDENISNMIAKKSRTEEISKYLYKNNYIDIKEHSRQVVEKGFSSKEEVYKVI